MKEIVTDFGAVMKFKDHLFANCKVIVHTDYNKETEETELKDIVLVSYSTAVLKYDAIKKELKCYGLYSMTTRRHISWFTEILQGVEYYDVKDHVGGSIKDVYLKVGWEMAFKQKTNWLPYYFVSVPPLLTEF